MTRVLRLYDYAASANCYKARLLLAQLGLDYERVAVDIFAGDTTTAAYRAKNPAGRTPVLELDSGETIAESNAILLYLGEGTPFVPEALGERARVWQWLFFEQNLFEPRVGGLRFRKLTGRGGRDPERLAELQSAAEEAMRMLDAHVAGRDFLVGSDYSVADTSLYAYAHVAGEGGLDLERYPGVRSWLARVGRTPRMMNDLQPYPENAGAGRGRSVHG
jgi:glutathione S-transferase